MIETNQNILKYLINTCVNNDLEAITSHEESIGKLSPNNIENGRGITKWNIIYNKLINNDKKIGFTAIKIHRGQVWTAVGAYIEKTKELYLFFRKPNFKSIMKHPWRGHYATVANIKNGNLKPLQQELSLDLEIEQEVIIEYDNLSEELFEKMGVLPDKVILCSFTTDEFKAHMYNNLQQLVWEQDFSYLIEPQYEELLNEQVNVIPPLKKERTSIVKPKLAKRRIKGLKKN